jgi:hypothetical protein
LITIAALLPVFFGIGVADKRYRRPCSRDARSDH